MKGKKKIVLACCFLALTALGMSGLTAAQQPNVLVVALATVQPEMTDLNPIKIFTTYYTALAYLNLIGWDKDGKVEPALAQSWNISPDGLTYTFTLRDGLKWSDGQPITSEDVAFTFKVFTEQSEFWYYQWTPIQVADSKTITGFALRDGAITTPDPKTVIFHLTAPSATFFIYAAGWCILPKHYYEGMDLTKQNPDLSTIVASGPFVPRQYIPGDRLVYDANPNYYGGKPVLDQIIFKFYRDSTAAEVALQTGEVNYMQDIPPQDATTLRNVPGLQVANEQNQINIFIIFNVYPKLADGSANPVSNLNVRKAIAMSLDLSNLLNASLGGNYKQANQIQVPNMYYLGKSVTNSSIPLPEYPYDTAAAAKLLDDAGYPVKDGKRFSLTLVMRLGRWGTAGYKMMQLVQSMLKVVKIDLQLILMETTSAIQRVYRAAPPKDWNMALASISSSPDPDVNAYFMVSSLAGNIGPGGNNAGGYDNAFVNQLVILGQNTTDVDKRVAVYQRISGIVHQDLPVLELYYQTEVIAWNKKYQGFILGLGNPMHDYWGALKYQSLSQVSIVQETTTTSETTTTAAPTDYTTISVVVVLAVVVAVLAYFMGRRTKKAT